METGKKVILIVVIILVGVVSLIAIMRMINPGSIEEQYIKMIKKVGSSNALNPRDFERFGGWVTKPPNLKKFKEYRRENNNKELEDCIRDSLDSFAKQLLLTAKCGLSIRKDGNDTVILERELVYQDDCIKNFMASNDVRDIKKAIFVFNWQNEKEGAEIYFLDTYIVHLVFPNSERFDIKGFAKNTTNNINSLDLFNMVLDNSLDDITRKVKKLS